MSDQLLNEILVTAPRLPSGPDYASTFDRGTFLGSYGGFYEDPLAGVGSIFSPELDAYLAQQMANYGGWTWSDAEQAWVQAGPNAVSPITVAPDQTPVPTTPIGGPNDPNFTWDLYNQLSGQLGQALTPGVTYVPGGEAATPTVRTIDDDIRDFFATGPTAQEVFDAMQQYGVTPQQVIDAMGFDPESAMAEYNTFLNAANAPAPDTTPGVGYDPNVITGGEPTEPDTDTSIFDPIKGVVREVGEVIDAGLITFGDIIGGFDPSLVVLNPTNPSATVVFGTPQGNATPTIIGNMPTSGAPIGVQTGNPIIDIILATVYADKNSNRDIKDVIQDAVLDTVGGATGYPVGAVVGAASGEIDDIVNSVYKVVLGLDEEIKKADEKYQMGPIDERPTTTTTPTETGPREYTLEEINEYINNTYGQDGITEEEAFQIAQDAINAGVTAQQIADATGVDLEEVLKYFPKEGGDDTVTGAGGTDTGTTATGTGEDTDKDKTTTGTGTTATGTGEDTKPRFTLDPATGTVSENDTIRTGTVTGAGGTDTVTGAGGTDTVTGAGGTDTDPVVVDPVIEKPVVVDPVIEKPVVVDPVIEKPVVVDPVVVDPVIEKPVVVDPVIEKPVVVDPVVVDPVIKKPVVVDPVIKKPVVVDPVIEKPVVVDPDGPVEPPRVPVVPAPTTPVIRQPEELYTQGMRGMSTEKAGVADIGTQYDLDASLLENIMRILEGKDDNTRRNPYYSGGQVTRSDDIDEIIRLIRG
jgi:hypothetical protein